MTAPRRGPARLPARRRPEPAALSGRVARRAALVLLPLAALVLAQRYGRLVLDSKPAPEVAALFARPLDAFPDVDGEAFFRGQHDRCFRGSYRLGWVWNRLDERAYLQCLDRGYAERMAKALVLEGPAWTPHGDPRWARLEFTVRLHEGSLPERMETSSATECEGGGTSSSSGPVDRSGFEEIAPGAFRGHTLVGLGRGACRLRFTLLSGRWPLGPPLVVALPAPDAARVQAREEEWQRDREAEGRTWQCVLAARAALPPLPPAYTDDGADLLSEAVRRLRSSDVSVRQEGARVLRGLGPAARSAIGELVRALGDTNTDSKAYVIEALVAADPGGETVAPALRCLAGEPKALVRARAAAALAALGDPAGLGMVEKEMQAPEEHARASLVRALRDFSARGGGVASLVAARLRSDPSPGVRRECATVLPWIDPHSADVVAALEAATRDPAPEVGAAARSSLRDLPWIRTRAGQPAPAPVPVAPSSSAALSPPDVERGKQAARENALLAGHEAFSREATREIDAFLDPLLETCALQDCLGAGLSNHYVVRVQKDGTVGEAFVEPRNGFTTCVADGLKARARLGARPPSDGYWLAWSVSGIMRLPEGCREEMTPPAWHTLKWWLFMAEMAFPRAAFRAKAALAGLSVLPFVLALAAWRALRPDEGGRALALGLLAGAGLVALAAAASFAVGAAAHEARDENRENVLLTLLLAFPLLGAAPFALRGLRRPRPPRGARLGPPTAGPARRAIGLVLLVAALLPAAGLAWFAVHENVHRLCPTCVEPYKVRAPLLAGVS